ncbi:M24 family metallopeptidase [Streptosporangium sp. NPDC003464]
MRRLPGRLGGRLGDQLQVGPAHRADLELIATAEATLQAAIAACVPGGRLGSVAHAVARVGRQADCEVPEDFGGHGLGRAMHEDPHVPNRGRPGRGMALRPGLVLAIADGSSSVRGLTLRGRPPRVSRCAGSPGAG